MLVQAEECLRKSLELNERLAQHQEMANAYGNLGLVFHDRGEREPACDFWSRALECFRQEEAGASDSAVKVMELLKTECESE